MSLVLGTHNRKKADELRRLLASSGIDVRSLAEIPNALQVAETGTTFGENAALKAQVQARHLRQWVLGEDSGLSVEALDGAPGVLSARFAGPEATDDQNNEQLLRRLEGLPLERRAAFYSCHATLSDPDGNIRCETEGLCRGRIRLEPAGRGGFGYDPLFEIPEYHRTFGQMGDAVKNVLSHRARALRAMIPELIRLMTSEGAPPVAR
jgi:XTP/dITP diphosphohydrolase